MPPSAIRASSETGALDSASLRADFPILSRRVHNDSPLIYLDNAATTQKPQAVIDALVEYYTEYNANVHRALHYLGEQATSRYEAVRTQVARFIGAPGEQSIVFTRGTTESVNLVACAWGDVHVSAGDEMVATVMEHHSNLVPWQMLAQRKGATLRLVPIAADGTLDLDAFHQQLSTRTRLVAVTHVSNVLGTVNPVRALADAAHSVGAKLFVDGAQAVPNMPVHVGELDADFYAFSSHKCCGPTGVGVLFARTSILDDMPPFMGGGEMIRRVEDDHATWADLPYKFEAGTPNIADVVAFGAAMTYLEKVGLERIQAYERQLADTLIEQLGHCPGVTVLGRAPERGGAVSFALDGLHPHDLAQYVDQLGIAIRAGHLCAQPLMRRLGVSAVSRASVYFYNTRAEVDALVDAIQRAQRFFGHG